MNTTYQPLEFVCNPVVFLEGSPFSTASDFSQLNQHIEQRSLDDVLAWSLFTFGDRAAQVTSFGPTGMVILERLARLSPGIRVITLDAQFLFDETYALIEEVQRRYPITLDIRRPALSPGAQVAAHDPRLWGTNPDACCRLRKVEPLNLAMENLDAWFTGLRRDQSPTRTNMPITGWDTRRGMVKINPLAHWTRSRVWKYIVENNVPYNRLHNLGCASIGCTHCTRPTTNPADERSGRWQNQAKTECGIHL